RVDEIGGDIAQQFGLAARPENFHRVHLVGRAQAKVRPQVVLREIAAAAPNFIELHDSGGVNGDTRADGGTIALGSNQVKGNAVVAVAGLVDQQRRWLADVEHQNVHVAVVINVAKSSAAARFRRHLEHA